MAGTIDLGEVKINTLKASRSLREMQEDIEEIDKKINEVKADKLAQVAEPFKNAALAAGAFVGVVAAATQQIATFAAQSERQSVALRGLGSAYTQVQLATAGAVTAQEAFATQNRLTQAHLRVNGDQLASITRAAREFALRTGTDTTQALNQLTEALANGDQRALRPFGVNVQVGTLRTTTFRQALTQLQTAQRGTAQSAETLTEVNARLGRAWETFRNDAAAATAETLNLKGAFSELADALTSLTDGGPLLHNFFEGILEDITGIQNRRTGTAEDRARNGAVEARISLGRALIGRGDVSLSGTQLNRLSEDQARGLVRRLTDTSNPLSTADAQALLNRAVGVSRVVDQQNAARATIAASNANNGSAADQAAERSRDMSLTDQFSLGEEQRQAREQVNQTVMQLQAQGIRVSPAQRQRLNSLIGGFLNPMNRLLFQREMAMLQGQSTGLSRGGFSGLEGVRSRYGAGLTNDQYLALLGADRDKQLSAAEMDSTVSAIGRAGRRYAGESVLLGGDSTDSLFSRFGTNLSAETYGQLAEAEQGKGEARAEMGRTVAGLARRNTLSSQLGDFFSDTQTLAEKGAKGFENAFNTMSGAVGGFIDALIEGQVPAGEAAVGLAKAALKGLAMQAVPESLFETAKGFAALATGNPMAATHFTAAGIYAAVAVAAGAGAAGISAAQRGAQATPGASSASLPAGTPSFPSSNNSREAGTVVFNINSTVFDPERAQETVARLMDGANRRGL